MDEQTNRKLRLEKWLQSCSKLVLCAELVKAAVECCQVLCCSVVQISPLQTRVFSEVGDGTNMLCRLYVCDVQRKGATRVRLLWDFNKRKKKFVSNDNLQIH